MTPRRHHYVWQKYLEPWTTKSGKAQQIWCLRKGESEPFCTDTTNVAVERDFYRLHDFHKEDADFVRALVFHDATNPALRKLNEGWIVGFERIFSLVATTKSHPGLSADGLRDLDKLLVKYQEDWHSRIETEASDFLPLLLAGDVQFFQNEIDATRFCYYLANQYFRTKAIKERTQQAHAARGQEQRFDRTWPVLRTIFSTNLGFALYVQRHTVPLQLMRAPTGVRFLTSDQPVINTYGASAQVGAPVDDLELFYPVSPEISVIFSGHSAYHGIHGQVLEPIRVNVLNRAMETEAHEQIFAATNDELKYVRFRE